MPVRSSPGTSRRGHTREDHERHERDSLIRDVGDFRSFAPFALSPGDRYIYAGVGASLISRPPGGRLRDAGDVTVVAVAEALVTGRITWEATRSASHMRR